MRYASLRIWCTATFYFMLAITFPLVATAQALLLYDGRSPGANFYGCLNCSRYVSESICNQYGRFGSRYSSHSIWNRYGAVGSEYRAHSPWNRYGEGLHIFDENGAYIGRLTIALSGRSRDPATTELVRLYEATDDHDAVRTLFCE